MPIPWKYCHHEHTPLTEIDGRVHYWHFNPEISPEADTILVRVIIPNGGMHNFHRHPEMNEILYIIRGRAEQWVENEKQILKPGDSVYIGPNVVHATFNASDDELEFLAILAPAGGWQAGTIDEYQNEPYKTYRNT